MPDLTVTFPATRHHRPLAGTKLYCLVTEAHVLTTCPGLHLTSGRLGFEPVLILLIASLAPYRYAIQPQPVTTHIGNLCACWSLLWLTSQLYGFLLYYSVCESEIFVVVTINFSFAEIVGILSKFGVTLS